MSRTWVFRKNNALSPRQMCFAYALAALLSLVVAFGFVLAGIWVVLPFAGLELLLLACAFLYCLEHSQDYDALSVSKRTVRVERKSALRIEVTEFVANWCQVELQGEFSPKLVLRSRGQLTEVGRFLGCAQKVYFAKELRLALALACK